MLNRRAQTELFDTTMVLFEIGLVLMVGVVLYGQFLKPIQENTYFAKTYLSNDLALLLSVIPLAENTALFYTPPSLEKFNYRLSDDVLVYETTPMNSGRASVGQTRAPYLGSKKLKYTSTDVLKPLGMTLMRNGDQISMISTKPTMLLDSLTCPKLESQKYILDIGHGGMWTNPSGVDTGQVNAGKTEAEILRTAALDSGMGTFATTRSLSKDQYLTSTQREETIKTSGLTLVSIHTGDLLNKAIIDYDGTSLHFPKNAAVACHLANALRAQGIDAIPMPIDPDLAQDTKKILKFAENGVYLEIGSINLDASLTTDLIQKTLRITRMTLET